jgi:hypothetical protein
MSKPSVRTAAWILGAFAPVLGACAHSTAEQPSAAYASAAACPLAQIHDVEASVTDINDGVAVTFVSPSSEQGILRGIVEGMVASNRDQGDPFAACARATPLAAIASASMQREPAQGRAEAMPPPPRPRALTCAPEAVSLPALPPVDAKVVETSAGPQLQLTLKDTTRTEELEGSYDAYNLRQLRLAVRQSVTYLNGGCLRPASMTY